MLVTVVVSVAIQRLPFLRVRRPISVEETALRQQVDEQQQDNRPGACRQHHNPQRDDVRLGSRFWRGLNLDLTRLQWHLLRSTDIR